MSNFTNFNNTRMVDNFSFTDIANIYILPFVCFFSIVLNCMSIITVVNIGIKKDLVNQYIFISSICSNFALILTSFTFVIRCGALCETSCKFSSKVYELYFHLYTANIMIEFNLILDAFFTFNRLIAFANYKFKTNKCYIIIDKIKYPLMIVFPILNNFPIYLLVRNVFEKNDQPSCFEIARNELGKSIAMKIVLASLALLRGVVLITIIFFMNCTIQYKFYSFMTKKNRILTISALVIKPSIHCIYKNKNLSP